MLFRQARFPLAQGFFEQEFSFIGGENFRIIARRIDVRDVADFQEKRARSEFEKDAVVEFKRSELRGIVFLQPLNEELGNTSERQFRFLQFELGQRPEMGCVTWHGDL